MKRVIEINKIKNLKERQEACGNYFLENGYLHNDITGWEKIETFEKFGLDPAMKGVPAKLYPDYELKEQKVIERDLLGKKTGTKSIFTKVYKDTFHWGATENFLAYKDWKNKKEKENYAIAMNTPTFI